MKCQKGHTMSVTIGVGIWEARCKCGVFTVSLAGKKSTLLLTPKKK